MALAPSAPEPRGRAVRADLSLRDIWETIGREAEEESALWGAALLREREREAVPVFSPLGGARFALGVETIYEGYLLHYGRPRLFAPPDPASRVLLGDYLYAHGLVRVAQLGDVVVVAELAELISLCAQMRADRRASARSLDGVSWAATVALLGADDGRLAAARGALRDR
ncbi:MAG: hypothetical protein M3312_02390, partial [Actinomycetota bacterium]|nr:hypothetical protein [Actinomycetota bacterium]